MLFTLNLRGYRSYVVFIGKQNFNASDFNEEGCMYMD